MHFALRYHAAVRPISNNSNNGRQLFAFSSIERADSQVIGDLVMCMECHFSPLGISSIISFIPDLIVCGRPSLLSFVISSIEAIREGCKSLNSSMSCITNQPAVEVSNHRVPIYMCMFYLCRLHKMMGDSVVTWMKNIAMNRT